MAYDKNDRKDERMIENVQREYPRNIMEKLFSSIRKYVGLVV